MNSFYFKTFARVCLLPYIGGTVIHILRLIYNFSFEDIPFEVDWFIVVIGGYGGIGLIVYAGKISYKNIWDKIFYALLILHLDGSVIVHAYLISAGNHNALQVFPYWYSAVAIGYFVALGLYVLRLIKRFRAAGMIVSGD